MAAAPLKVKFVPDLEAGSLVAAVIDTVLRGGDGTIFEHARRLGFAGVEVALGPDDLRPPRPERPASLQSARAETGLVIPSLIVGPHNELGGIADEDPAVAARAAGDVRVAIAWAAELGADVVLVPFFLRADIRDAQAFDRCVSAFRELCPEAAAAGVTLCYEGTLPARDVRLLAEQIASAAFGCYFDLANPIAEGFDTATEALQLGGLIRRVHFKDSAVRRGDSTPGLGRVDFEASAQALSDVGYDGWLVLETPAGPPPLVARDLSFARTHFPALEPPVVWPRFGAFTHELGVPFQRIADACRALGVETVQPSRALLEEWLDEPRELGIDVAALGGYKNLIAPDMSERRENIEFVGRCLERAPVAGTWIVTTHAGTRHPTEEWADTPENRSPEAWSLLIDAVERLLPVAEGAGTVLALEGSVKSVLHTVGQAIELLDRFPSPHLQLVCDPYNYVSSHLLPAQERVAREFLDRFEHRFVVAHLKDVGPDGAEVSTPTFGTGVFDQRPYLDFLRTRRPDLPLILEHLTREQIPHAVRAITSG
jgi:sugar phosphate isomerase/epimerase